MATCLIVSAHPSPVSFTAAWAQASTRAARNAGYTVLQSDLYAMAFDPAERAAPSGIEGAYDPLKAQETGRVSADAAREAAKIEAAELVVFHFPIWWFGPPAILKGWCDRALIHGRLHDVDHRFDTGPCRGKTALFCVTTGAGAAEVGPGGKEGRLDLLLWPLAYTLRYCGFDIAEPVAEHGVHGYWEGADKAALDTRLAARLGAQQALIADLPNRPRWRFHPDDDFDAAGRLKPGIAPLWPFHG
ncbi:NAD(P)H-dependent oxidoreductase [Thalassococcus sp. CAU 1522]|uniref:NAD(P)H-dependent oxidoreductase n=1 Tax=Thalassococcus arenae TaxID=2851652 RepID=A0ABS6N5Y9_9RHOB|nr:NAD(P)H-dependent oxidoreductase [Thalassococcus arenae]MBV2359057.1 NAD(P)H-dependent oxidoreductase [Thalassococcus arenae]